MSGFGSPSSKNHKIPIATILVLAILVLPTSVWLGLQRTNLKSRADIAPATPTTPPSPTNVIVPGDANGDRKVDGLDYIIWLNNYNTTTDLGPSVGDFNKDRRVDGLDYIIWLTNYT